MQCPVENVVSLKGSKWMFRVLVQTHKAQSFGDLLCALYPITNKMLTQSLKKAVAAGYLTKTADRYMTTVEGKKVVRVLSAFASVDACKRCDGSAVCLSTSS